MYCPKCGSNQSDEQKFCKSCGANLHAVRQAVATREAGEPEAKYDWSKTWIAEMLLAEEEKERRKMEREKRLGITPEVKRAEEVKGGVITSCVGIGLMIFLFVFMQGLIKSGVIPAHVAEILSHVWIAGIIPFFVGVGLVLNGVIFSKRLGTGAAKELSASSDLKSGEGDSPALRPADTTEFITPDFSVTEGTTKHLSSSGQKR